MNQQPLSVLLITSKSLPGFNLAPPMGICRLRDFLQKSGLVCEILDLDLGSETDFLTRVAAGTYDVIGMSVSHVYMENDLETLVRFHQASRQSLKTPVWIAGGQEATLNHKEWLNSGLVDLIFLGFAEESLRSFCLELSKARSREISRVREIAGRLDGVVFLEESGNLRHRAAGALSKEKFRELSFLNVWQMDVPFQKYWDRLRAERFEGVNRTEFIIETVRLYTTSHCPRCCGFCSSQSFLPESQKKASPIYLLPAEDVFDLVVRHAQQDGARAFLFSDDDFIVGNAEGFSRIKRFCALVAGAKETGRISPDIRFFFQSRIADYLDRGAIRQDLLDSLRRAGFDNTGLGVETFSDRLLKAPSVNKVGVTSADCRKVLDALLAAKLIPIIFVILGIPETTVAELIQTMKIAVEYIFKGADISVTPKMRFNPGSPLSSNKDYPIHSKIWINPPNGHPVTIREYFIPRDPQVAAMVEQIDTEAARQMESIKKKRGLHGSVAPKSFVALATFIAAAKLLEQPEAAAHFTAAMERAWNQ